MPGDHQFKRLHAAFQVLSDFQPPINPKNWKHKQHKQDARTIGKQVVKSIELHVFVVSTKSNALVILVKVEHHW